MSLLFFFFNDTATTEIYTLSLHDALPIWFVQTEPLLPASATSWSKPISLFNATNYALRYTVDRKSTRLNSSHANISYAVFCLKKKTSPTTPFCVRKPSSPEPRRDKSPHHV